MTRTTERTNRLIDELRSDLRDLRRAVKSIELALQRLNVPYPWDQKDDAGGRKL